MSTTFILEPDDYSNITFNVITPEGSEGGYTQSNYSVLLSSIALSEEARIQLEYAQYQHREGGEVRDTRYPLVPITFTVRVVGLGATLESRREDLLEKCSDLMRAIYNSNGYLKYKPDGLGAAVLDTYYRYIQSAPPRPLMGEKEYWGRPRAAGGDTVYVEGYPTRQFEITLMTQPIAMSDPDNPYEVLAATTLNNIGDGGGDDNLTIVAATVKGAVPAVVRIIAHPLTAGADAAIGTLWIAKRTSGLGSFVSTYLTATHQAPAGVWSTMGDGARSGNAYYRCTPTSNGVVYATRYTIANWSSHKGRAAILIVARNNGTDAADFDVYYRWAIANYPLVGEKKQLARVGSWEPLLLGEIDLPETEMSAQEELDLYIDICVVRVTGSGTFDIDAIKLLYTDEAAIQVDMPAGEGASTTHSFLLENFDEEIAHAIIHATDKLAYICNPYGDFITLEPDVDNRLDVAWQHYGQLAGGGAGGGGAFEDGFDGYDSYWRKIADFESTEDWANAVVGTNVIVEGSQAIVDTGNVTYFTLDTAMDLSGVADGDWICLAVFDSDGGSAVTIRFYTTPVNDFYDSGPVTPVGGGSRWGQFKVKKSNFSAVGSPDWSNITKIYISNAGGTMRYDDLRISSADPDDAGEFDETHGVWDQKSGAWHIEELTGAGRTLGAMYTGASTHYLMCLIATDYGGGVKFRAKVRARDTKIPVDIWNEYAGLVFRCSDGTYGSEDCYAFLIYPPGNTVYLRSFVAGAVSTVASAAFTCSADTDYYVGVIANGTSIQCFVSTALSELWNVGNRLINTADSDHSTGNCGLMVRSSHGRFDDVRLEQVGDLHIPGDQIQLSAFALFRTIYPFHEDAP